MPVGGAHRGMFKSSGGSSTSDSFDRANGAIGSTNGGDILPWQDLSGVWSITTNRPTTATAAASNPLTVVDTGSSDVDVSIDVATGGGDALYFRVADAANWWRMRVDNYSYTYNYSYTCEYSYSYTCYSQGSYTCYATQFCNVYTSSCGYGAGGSITPYHTHTSTTCYSYAASSCCTDLTHSHYQTNGQTALHFHSGGTQSGPSYSSNSACGSYSYTCYQQVANTCYATSFTTCYADTTAQEIRAYVEKSVGGTITSVANFTPDPTSLRAVAVGSTITPYVNGAAQTSFSDAAHSSATKHGIGKGASTNTGTAIDNFSLTDKS